ncbi:MAG: glycosyltransferase family 39 protein [Rhodobacteraceae bacterium]|nr:glycosyltransferase family 39 protein [Paracoccaceae bacterium]
MSFDFDQRRTWLVLFAAYFAVTGLMRLWSGHALEIDQAEMLRYAQALQWGYGPQPPLYAWMQWGVFQIVGPGVPGLFLLKQFLLWLTPVLMLVLLSRAFPVREAGIAALSLVLLVSISFDSQRTLTHAVLVLDVTLAFALVAWLVLREDEAHPSDWLGLGVLMGFGFLSKPSFALVPVAMLAAIVTLPALRKGFKPQGMVLALGVAVLICLGPAIWMLINLHITLDSVRKFDIVAQAGFAETLPVSLREYLWSTVLFVGPALIVVGIAAALGRLRGPAPEIARTGPEELMSKWLWRFTLIAWGLFLLFTLAGQVTHFKERWLQTTLVFSAPLLTLWLLPRLTPFGQRVYVITLLVCVGLVGSVLSVQDALRGSRRAASFDVLAPQVRAVLEEGDILLGENWIAGNLLKVMPDVPVHPEYAPLDPERGYIFVWNNTLEQGDGAAQLVRQAGPGWVLEPLGRIEAPYHVDPDRVLVLNLARVRPGG